MNLNLEVKMLQNLSEGIILLTISGHIMHFNKAANPWLKQCFNASYQLATLINEFVLDNIRLPILVNIEGLDDRNEEAVKTYLCGYGKSDFILLLMPAVPPPTQDTLE